MNHVSDEQFFYGLFTRWMPKVPRVLGKEGPSQNVAQSGVIPSINVELMPVVGTDEK